MAITELHAYNFLTKGSVETTSWGWYFGFCCGTTHGRARRPERTARRVSTSVPCTRTYPPRPTPERFPRGALSGGLFQSLLRHDGGHLSLFWPSLPGPQEGDQLCPCGNLRETKLTGECSSGRLVSACLSLGPSSAFLHAAAVRPLSLLCTSSFLSHECHDLFVHANADVFFYLVSQFGAVMNASADTSLLLPWEPTRSGLAGPPCANTCVAKQVPGDS